MSRLTGLAFDDRRGRLYYTIDGDRRLFYRYFTRDGAVVGGQPFVVSGAGDGLDWSNIRGLTLVADQLYFARRDGALQRAALQDGRPAAGSVIEIDHQRNWAGRGMFLFSR